MSCNEQKIIQKPTQFKKEIITKQQYIVKQGYKIMNKPQIKKYTIQQQRKEKISPFYQHLSKLNILQDLTSHKALLSQTIETDQLNMRRLSSEVIEDVPLKFNSAEHYIQLWQRLFYEEAKAQIYRSKQEEAKQAEPVKFQQLRDYEGKGSTGFKLFLFQRPNNQKFSYNIGSLVVISPVKPQKNTNYPHLVGFIEQGEMLTVKAIFNETIRKRNEQDWQLMSKTEKWYIQQICSINTLERQYYALTNLSRISQKLSQTILRPDQHNKQIDKKFKIPIKLDQKLKNSFNQSQYKAIYECLKQSGITLIQGPPGTGKTKTVLGTLSVLLSSYRKTQQQQFQPLILNWTKSCQVQRDNNQLLNPWLYHGYTDWRDQPYVQNQDDPLNLTSCYLRCDYSDRKIILTKKQEGFQLPQKVLICGPSNASVDQIIRKLLKQQLIDGDGHTYLPNFVRVGQHYDQSLKQYSLDSIAQKMTQKQRGADLSLCKHKILNEYRLIFATLSAAGNQIMQTSNAKFDTVVIDEAGQSIQISNLIPLLYGCQRLILIGDPNQLPATIFSQKSLDHKYDQSLFERLMKSGYPVSVLKTQYRMHPDISAVIGNHFYGQKLSNWDKMMVEEPKATPSAFLIFHIDQAPQSSFNKSFRNMTQAKAVKDFAAYLSKFYQDIGIVSPYSQQVFLIQNMIGKNKKCEVKTIDSFQGREKDVILFSAVRSRYIMRNKKLEENKRKTIGFVSDLRRINVSLSRAKNLCVIFGDIKRLSINSTWRNIIQQAMAKNQVFQFSQKKNFFSSFKQTPQKYRITSIEQKKMQ